MAYSNLSKEPPEYTELGCLTANLSPETVFRNLPTVESISSKRRSTTLDAGDTGVSSKVFLRSFVYSRRDWDSRCSLIILLWAVSSWLNWYGVRFHIKRVRSSFWNFVCSMPFSSRVSMVEITACRSNSGVELSSTILLDFLSSIMRKTSWPHNYEISIDFFNRPLLRLVSVTLSSFVTSFGLVLYFLLMYI